VARQAEMAHKENIRFRAAQRSHGAGADSGFLTWRVLASGKADSGGFRPSDLASSGPSGKADSGGFWPSGLAGSGLPATRVLALRLGGLWPPWAGWRSRSCWLRAGGDDKAAEMAVGQRGPSSRLSVGPSSLAVCAIARTRRAGAQGRRRSPDSVCRRAGHQPDRPDGSRAATLVRAWLRGSGRARDENQAASGSVEARRIPVL
jgi:hypothetical protein